MKSIESVQPFFALFERCESSEEAIGIAKVAAESMGMDCLGIGAEDAGGVFTMRFDGFPQGCYQAYIKTFSQANPIRNMALSRRRPYHWTAADFLPHFDAQKYGLQWGVSLGETLEDGQKCIVNYASTVTAFPGSKLELESVKCALLRLNTEIVTALDRTGWFSVSNIDDDDWAILSLLANGKEKKAIAAEMKMSASAVYTRIKKLLTALSCKTTDEAIFKMASKINSKRKTK